MKKQVFTPFFYPAIQKNMATSNFLLRPQNKKGECPIILFYQDKGQRFKYYTRLKVVKSSWNYELQKVKQNCIGYSEINGILDAILNTIKTIEREALFNNRQYTVDTIRRKFLLKVGKVTQEGDFFKVYDKFIEDSRDIRSTATIQTYEATKGKLLDFVKAKKVSISFEAIDQNFYEAFLNYMIRDLKHLNNTVGKHIKTLKVFLTYALDHEFTTQKYNLKKFKAFSEEADIIYLTEAELWRIYKLQDLPRRLSDVRDSFCFACFTGLRFSDIDKLRHTHIKEDFLEIRTEKTKDSLKIPLNQFAKEILNRYKQYYSDRPLPTGLTNQKTNEYLKEIGQAAELNDEITMEKFSGSNKIIVENKKWELLTTHTARRTFVTLALEKGIRAEVVMAMTGHKSYKTFKRYIKITDKVMQTEMNRVWNKNPYMRIV
jgi:site-specific recombinase XerD